MQQRQWSESEELYRVLTEAASCAGIGIFMLQDSDAVPGSIVFVNDHALSILGCAREDIQGTGFLDIVVPEKRQEMSSQYRRRQAGDRQLPVHFELELLSNGGVRVPVHIGAGTTTYRGKAATIAYVRDTSQTVKAEKALEQVESQLMQSDKLASIGQLAAGVAHELNNPIAFISSNIGVLGEYFVDIRAVIVKYREAAGAVRAGDWDEAGLLLVEASAKEIDVEMDFLLGDVFKLIKQSQDGTERVRRIVTDLRNFARADTCKPEYADINECVESTLSIVWNELKYKATIRKDLGDIPKTWCHAMKRGQVFMNLLVNAAQAISDKGEIAIKTFSENGYICAQVSDTGCGIPREHLPKLFEPFFTTKPVGSGTGLGLSVAYGITRDHGGSISVESEVGKGTTFTVRIPVMSSPLEAATAGDERANATLAGSFRSM
ncbi:MAG: ATP-binding protein [Dehalococcoidia bacterium]|nr:ATP-binding protein [Dehalococcoidia bacterium]